MSTPKTYVARWYVNGVADIALVSEEEDELAREVVKVYLERRGIRADRGKIRLSPYEPKVMGFRLLSDRGRV